MKDASVVHRIDGDPDRRRWWAFHQGEFKPVGWHTSFDDAVDKADKDYPGNVWILDQEGMENLHEQMRRELQLSLSGLAAADLRKLVKEHTEAQVALSWAGAQTPADADELRKDAEHARLNLERHIRKHTRRNS